jgi:hypothetical protein
MPTSPAQLEAMNYYVAIMEEIKIRINAIDLGTGGFMGQKLPPVIIREHCFLQIRLICELVALGALVAHGDIKNSKMGQLKKMWDAKMIMDGLEKLHPQFYPATARQGRNEHGYTITGVNPHPLPKKDFLTMYGKCGDVLHRGNAKKLLSSRDPIVIHYPDITAMAQRFLDMLSVHLISLHDGSAMVCVLHAADRGMQTSVAHMEPVPQEQWPGPLPIPITSE